MIPFCLVQRHEDSSRVWKGRENQTIPLVSNCSCGQGPSGEGSKCPDLEELYLQFHQGGEFLESTGLNSFVSVLLPAAISLCAPW